ncbi:MAG TPA: protein kinase [Bacteroidales bacterium]|nr:protein kinase [Bacteroidales bacterium]
MNILIIDDTKDFIESLNLILSSHMKQARLIEYDLQGLGKPGKDFDWSTYDLLLLDYNLGKGEDGIEWLRELGRYENMPPIIMLTGEGDEYVAVNAIKLGAADYINKNDITPRRLVNAISGARTEYSALNPDKGNNTSLSYGRSDNKRVAVARDDKSGLVDIGYGYKFVSQIAEGGMSRVYLAERLKDSQTVVLKILDLTSDIDEILVTRFVQEAELLSGLKSPFVVNVYDYGLTNDYAFIALEFFSRGDLKQRMQQQTTTDIALTYINHIAYGLDAIHNVGIVHRDLKPANIMFRGDDSLAIADFGIAKRLNTAFDITTIGQILGSPHYMSPEQASGSQINCYADIYSAGVILFELLTGNKPYSGKTHAEIIYQHKYAPVPKLPDKYSQYQNIIDRTMAKKPANRYDSRRLILAIEAALEETNV